tara:strand:- start:330 stop:527 length:198 start_codon:yes stop_codon:yes gene_type:complete
MKSIELDNNEISATIQLIDIAIKHPQLGGGKVAGAGSFLLGKFTAALNEGAEEPQEVEQIEEVEE